jgi:hypothetical protein
LVGLVLGRSVLKEPRIYAVTRKSRPIAAAFTVIAASQLALGIYLTFLTATHAGEPLTFSKSPTSSANL